MEHIRKRILEKIEDLQKKIAENEPGPEIDQDIELLVAIDEKLDEILMAWYY